MDKENMLESRLGQAKEDYNGGFLSRLRNSRIAKYIAALPLAFICYCGSGKSNNEQTTPTSYNRPPIFSGLTGVIMNRNTPTTINLNDYITDPEGDAFTCSADASEHFDISVEDCLATITPETDYVGDEPVQFIAIDYYGASSSQNVNLKTVIPPNSPPIFSGLEEIVTNKNISVSVNLLDYITDPEGDSITCSAGTPQNFGITIDNCVIAITPNPEYWGSEPVTFTATDSKGDSSSKNVNLTANNPYGCESIYSQAVMQDNGSHNARVDLRFYSHPTGIILQPNNVAAIMSEGSGCWNPYSCAGPDVAPSTWGLYAGLRRVDTGDILSYGYLGSTGAVQNYFGVQCELVFFIPDGSSNSGCVESYYSDNGAYGNYQGYFTSNITIN